MAWRKKKKLSEKQLSFHLLKLLCYPITPQKWQKTAVCFSVIMDSHTHHCTRFSPYVCFVFHTQVSYFKKRVCGIKKPHKRVKWISKNKTTTTLCALHLSTFKLQSENIMHISVFKNVFHSSYKMPLYIVTKSPSFTWYKHKILNINKLTQYLQKSNHYGNKETKKPFKIHSSTKNWFQYITKTTKRINMNKIINGCSKTCGGEHPTVN